MFDDMSLNGDELRDLSSAEVDMVAGGGCRTEVRLRCNSSGECYAEAVLICEF